MESQGQQTPHTYSRTTMNDPHMTYCNIISSKDMKIWNLVHKGTSALLLVFFYVFYMSYYGTFKTHIYLTTWGLVITLISRLFAFIHHLLKVKDNSRVTTALCFIQVLNFSIEGTICIFYWTILSPSDLPELTNGYEQSTNIFNHVMCFLLSFIPVCFERNDFDQRFYFFGVLVLALCYLIFLTSYTVSTGYLIYSVMTFKSWMTGAYIIAALLLNSSSMLVVIWIEKI